MTKTIFEEMGGTYRQVGDYLLPNITVPAEEEIEPIGLWGKRHARHLKEHYKVFLFCIYNFIKNNYLNNR